MPGQLTSNENAFPLGGYTVYLTFSIQFFMKLVYQTFFGLSMLLISFSLSATNITFQVDMSAEDVSADGVSVAYAPPSMSGLGDVTIIALDDADGDGIYTGTSDVMHDTIGYFFINGMASNPGNFETVPDECGLK